MTSSKLAKSSADKKKKNDWKSGRHSEDDMNAMDAKDTSKSELPDDAITMTAAQDPMDVSWGDVSGSGSDAERQEQKKVEAEVRGLVQRENRAVRLLRVAVMLVLIAAAFVTIWLVYDTFRAKEYQAFEEEYRAISTRVIDLYRNDILQKLLVARNLASTLTAMIQAQKLVAPNITIPSFHLISASAIKLAPVGTIKWAPLLLNPQDVQEFAAYSAFMFNLTNLASTKPADDEPEELEEDDKDTRRRLLLENQAFPVYNISSPVWQASPSFGSNHNARSYDLMTNLIFRDALLAMMEIKGPVMSRTYILGPAQEEGSEDEEEESEDEGSEDESEDEANAAGPNEQEEDEDEDKNEETEVEEHEQAEGTPGETKPEPETDNVGNNLRRRRRRRRLEASSESESSDAESDGDGMERAMTLFFPVFDDELKTNIIGSLSLELVFGAFLSGYLSHEGNFKSDYAENVFDTDEVDAILENTCGQVFSTLIDDSKFLTTDMLRRLLIRSNLLHLCLLL
jgi:hypothetical protein